MSTFLEAPMFGRLEYFEVYDYYDKPLFFTCTNIFGHLFLVIFVDQTQNEQLWLMIQLSQNRLEIFRTGGFDTREIFLKSENNTIYLVKTPYDSTIEPSIISFDTELIDDDLLPFAGEFLKIDKPLHIKTIDIGITAIQENRVVSRLKFDYKERFRHEAPIKDVGNTLVRFQELSNAIGQSQVEEEVSTKGPIPTNIVAVNEWNAVTIMEGSFVIQIASSKLVDLFQESSIEKTVAIISELLNIGSEPERLKNRLRELQSRVASKYYDFLESINESIESVSLEWASPKTKKGLKSAISYIEARTAMAIIELADEEKVNSLTITGTLTSASINKKNCEFTTPERQEYKCTFSSPEIINGAVIGGQYKAVLKEYKKFIPSKNMEEISYELISLLLVVN